VRKHAEQFTESAQERCAVHRKCANTQRSSPKVRKHEAQSTGSAQTRCAVHRNNTHTHLSSCTVHDTCLTNLVFHLSTVITLGEGRKVWSSLSGNNLHSPSDHTASVSHVSITSSLLHLILWKRNAPCCLLYHVDVRRHNKQRQRKTKRVKEEQKIHLDIKVFLRLTLILLTWKIWWDPNNASRWQNGI